MAHISHPLCYPLPCSLFAHTPSPSLLVTFLVLLSPPLCLPYIIAYTPPLLFPYISLSSSLIYLTSPPILLVLFSVSQIVQMGISPLLSFIRFFSFLGFRAFPHCPPYRLLFGGLVSGFLVLFCFHTQPIFAVVSCYPCYFLSLASCFSCLQRLSLCP